MGDWTNEGPAFLNQPTFDDNLHARTAQESNHEGGWWIGTRENRRRFTEFPGGTQGNLPIGVLTSPKFLIISSKLSFMFAGSGTGRVELVIDDTVARVTTSGTGSESMTAITWNVNDMINREAVIRLIDDDPNGFVSFDGLKASIPIEGDHLFCIL